MPRLNLDVSSAVKDTLETLQARTDATSLTEVVRRALAFYDLATEHSSEQGDIVFRHSDGTEEVLKLL